MTVRFTVEATGPNVTTLRIPVETRTEWEQWVLLRSDAHHDNPHCHQAMERRHLQEAAGKSAAVLDFGDLFCAMQGKYDKRSDKSCLRPEHQCDRYLDRLVETAADFYAPFAPNIVVCGQGNHETSILKRHETNLTERLVERMNTLSGSKVRAGGYTGWVRFMFERGSQRLSRRLWWNHGYGGGGPVTQDMIQAQRQKVYVMNADFMCSGHTHDSWCMDRVSLKLNDAGRIERRTCYSIKCPTYKDEYGEGDGGWHVETGKPPKPLGAYWIRFFWDRERGLREQVIRAD